MSLPEQPAGVPWPTREWPVAIEAGAADALLDDAFGVRDHPALGQTHAVVVVRGGRIVAERYAEGMDAATSFPSWSKAKSVTQALVGLLVGDGRIDVAAPADVPEWRDDERAAITLDQLLRMSSGLKFTEAYVEGEPSDVIEMLFGRGKDDVAGFAAGFPLAYPLGSHFSYSSGTTNIVARCATRALGGDFARFMRERLFAPVGMTSAAPRFDASGTFIGSSFCFATARDFARFGLLYLRDGVWDGRRLLPEGWVDHARTPTRQQAGVADGPYGAHWWLGMAGDDSFSANGYEGQYTVVVPDLDMVVVRHGRTPLVLKENLGPWIAALVDTYR